MANENSLYSKTEKSEYFKLSDGNIGIITLESLPDRIKKYDEFFLNEDIVMNSFALMPTRNNDRLISQKGYFTVQGTYNKALEEEYKESSCMKRVIIKKYEEDEIRLFMKLNSINSYTIYGGIEGLAKYIKETYLSDFESQG